MFSGLPAMDVVAFECVVAAGFPSLGFLLWYHLSRAGIGLGHVGPDTSLTRVLGLTRVGTPSHGADRVRCSCASTRVADPGLLGAPPHVRLQVTSVVVPAPSLLGPGSAQLNGGLALEE
ncbi:hypothetical protein Cni_G19689 [Canna indica]|uniref:Uncharacterized protein n=1 Tax=Canna indica TaxID=4628 RepID=A0AAQ3KLR5_9LILI|nr:hypothetical protein Cni_G19689 [Canna indica]